MESVPLASNGPPRYNGSYLSGPGAPEEDFGPETDVDGDSAALVKRHIQEEVMKASAKGLGSGDHVLQLSSDSEEGEGEEGGGWNFVQTPSGKKNTPPIGTNFDSEDSEDDMNHPLNPDAAEFVPVHSPVRKSHSGEEEFFASKNGNGVDAHNGKREDGKGTRWEDEDPVIACSPQKPNILDRLENERDFLSDIQKRPSSGFENGDHEEMNGFQSLDSSHTHATLGDATYLSDLTSPAANHIGSGDVTTSSLSPSSPELHTGATTNPFDLSSVSNALDNVTNDQSHEFKQNAKDDQDDFGFKASPPLEDNRFSNDFTGTNQEVMENETLVTPIVDTGSRGTTDETRVGQHDAENESHTTVGSDTLNDLGDPETKPTPDTLNTASGELLPGRQVARSPVSPVLDLPDLTSTSFGFASPAVRNSTVNELSPRDQLSDSLDDYSDIYSIKTLSPYSANSFTLPEHQDVADFTATQFDANTFSEFHTANDASGMFEKTNETSGFFGKDQTQTDLTLPSHVRLSGAEETITSMMDLIDTPQARRVSGDVLDAYNSVVHSMDTPSPQHTTLDVGDDFGFNQPARETLESFAKPKEEDFSDNGYIEKHVDEVKSKGVGETQEESCEKRGVPQGSDAGPESETNSNPFGDQTHHTETDEFEFHQEANVNSAVSAPDDLIEKLERETEVQTFIIGGATPMDFLQKYSGDSRSVEFTDEIHGIHKDEESRQDDFVGNNANKDSIKEEEEEEEIQIGKKVSDLNESDIMSRSFYGDYESQEVARSPSPEEMIDHYAGRQHEMLVEDPMEPREQELTPTGDATTLEAKLAEEHSQQSHDVEDKPQEDSPQSPIVEEKRDEDSPQSPIVEEKREEDSPQFHHVEETPEEDRPQYSNEEKPLEESQQIHHADEKPSTMFDISHEETSFTEKAEEVFDDLTFETKLNESSSQAEPKSPVAVTMETNLDDFTSQETKLDAGIIECQPLEGTKPEEHSEETVVSAPTIPDVVPTQGDDSQSTPVVDLTQDIVEDSKVPSQDDGKASAEEPTVDKATVEIVEEPKETCASDVASTVAAVGALAAGAAAATVAVKKATSAAKKPSTSSVTKKPDVKPANKTSATKPLLKPSVAKTSSKPAGPVAAPAKPATKTVAPKPLVSRPAAKTAAPKPATTSTAAPKTSSTSTAAPKPTAPRKPIAGSTLTKTTASATPKPAAAKPAAPKPRPASSVATKPLTNGVTKRPASAASTAAAPSKPPAAARVPLSLRTSAAKPLTTAKTSVSSTAKPSTTAKSSVTAPKSSTTAAKTSATALNSSKSSTQAKSPSAAAAAVAAARKSPLTRRPLSNPAKGKSTPSAMTKTEPRTEAEAVIRKPVPPPGETASVEVMTNGH